MPRRTRKDVVDMGQGIKEFFENVGGRSQPAPKPKPKGVSRPNQGVKQNVHNMATKGTGRYAVPKRKKK